MRETIIWVNMIIIVIKFNALFTNYLGLSMIVIVAITIVNIIIVYTVMIVVTTAIINDLVLNMF